MRSVLIVLTVVTAAFAQGGSKPPDTAAQALDDSLAAWEKRMSQIDGLKATCKLTEIDDTEKVVYSGDVSFMRPNYAKLFLALAADPKNERKWRHLIADGTDLWNLNHRAKTAVSIPMVKADAFRVVREGFERHVALLTGMKVADLKSRYELSVNPDDPKQFNDFYVHLTIKPKTKADLQGFKKGELVLWRDQSNPKFAANYMLPARIWFQYPNGDQVVWEFSNFEEKKYNKADFTLPKLPADWTIERAGGASKASRPK